MRTEDRLDLALWPSTAVDFIFQRTPGGESRGLTLAVAFDPSAYSAESPERALEDAQAHEAIGRQFADAGITLQSSLDANRPHALDPAVFAAFAERVAAYLRDLVKGSMPVPPAHVTIDVAVEPEIVDDLFALDVEIAVSTAQGQATSKISPRTSADFAGAFESAYADKDSFLKVLSERESANVERLWVMRLRRQGAPAGPGISFACNGPARYYAPVPLSNVPLSRSDVPLVRFDPDKGIDWDEPDYTTYSEIDLDKWARLALCAIDRVLSADLGAQSEDLRKLSEIKSQLAALISSTLAPILINSGVSYEGPPFVNAVKTMRQQMLAKVESVYEIFAICQFEATVASQYIDEPISLVYAPRFAGTLRSNVPGAGEAPPETWRFTPVRAVLAPGKAFVSSALTFAHSEMRTNLPLDLFFDIEWVYYAQARSHLSFVIPFDRKSATALETTIGAVDIPVVLREIPRRPVLVSQEATPAGKPAVELADARLWTYAFTYDSSVAERDAIDISVSFNVPEGGAETDAPAARAGRDLDLLDHLARIAAVCPALPAMLTQAPPSQRDALLSGFVRLVEPLPSAWAAWQSVIQGPHAVQVDVSLRERDKDGCLALTRTLQAGAGALPEPVIQLIDGAVIYTARPDSRTGDLFYVDESGKRLTSEVAHRLTTRRVVFTGLDIATLQNASSAVRITRNRDLVGQGEEAFVQTNPQFVYATIPVQFAGNVTPQLSSGECFDVSVLSSPRQQPLATHLERLLATLYVGTRPGAVQALRLDAACVQRLGDGLPEQVMPVFAGVEMPLDKQRANQVACESAAVALNWFTANLPADGYFRFTLMLFSTLRESRLPLLELTGLELAFGDITDLSKEGADERNVRFKGEDTRAR